VPGRWGARGGRKALSSPVGLPERGWMGSRGLASTAPAAWARASPG